MAKRTKQAAKSKPAHVEVTVSIDGADRDPLGALRGLTRGMRGLDATVPQVVAFAREQRCTWAEIGDALGITRQSAWERFSRT
jgi:ATP-dependent Clp protease ATP-binding subunit ClpX